MTRFSAAYIGKFSSIGRYSFPVTHSNADSNFVIDSRFPPRINSSLLPVLKQTPDFEWIDWHPCQDGIEQLDGLASLSRSWGTELFFEKTSEMVGDEHPDARLAG